MKKSYTRARINKDKNFDGEFFFGVKTTGIFCRPSCPAPVAREENVQYFETIFEALESGFRPCMRCRPDVEVEFYNGNVEGASLVECALQMIHQGYLDNHGVSELADELSISERHLRTLFTENIGAPPVKIDRYRKVLFAKKMLLNSSLSITDIAFASGFGSIRQFNQGFRDIFGTTPSEIREEITSPKGLNNGNTMLVKYSSSPHFKGVLAFLAPRAIKGVEFVTDESYSRTFRTESAAGYFTVKDNPRLKALELKIDSSDIRCSMEIYNRVRVMFDLDTDFLAINKKFRKDPLLVKGMDKGEVPRLPVAWSPFEFVVRAILGQQITVKAATTLAGRIAAAGGGKTDSSFPPGLEWFFPEPGEIASLNLGGIGITGTRQETIKRVTGAILEGKLSLSRNQPFHRFHESFLRIKGIGEWTVNYVAMRGLGWKDCFPAEDLGIIKALSSGEKKKSPKEILALAEEWRPWRSYAALTLWNIKQEKV